MALINKIEPGQLWRRLPYPPMATVVPQFSLVLWAKGGCEPISFSHLEPGDVVMIVSAKVKKRPDAGHDLVLELIHKETVYTGFQVTEACWLDEMEKVA